MRVLTPINLTLAGSDTNVLTYAYDMLPKRPEAAKFLSSVLVRNKTFVLMPEQGDKSRPRAKSRCLFAALYLFSVD